MHHTFQMYLTNWLKIKLLFAVCPYHVQCSEDSKFRDGVVNNQYTGYMLWTRGQPCMSFRRVWAESFLNYQHIKMELDWLHRWWWRISFKPLQEVLMAMSWSNWKRSSVPWKKDWTWLIRTPWSLCFLVGLQIWNLCTKLGTSFACCSCQNRLHPSEAESLLLSAFVDLHVPV